MVEELIHKIRHSKVVDHSKIWKILFERPILKLVILFFIIGVLFNLIKTFSDALEIKPILNILLFILIIATSVYSGILIVRIILVYLIRRPLKQLFSAQNILSLLFSYAIFVFGILILISVSFMEIQHLDLGYITYGNCGDKFDKNMIDTDPKISHDYLYFSAVTFFTIGYGDICPMGAAKVLSIVTAFIGNIVTVVIMAIVITTYLKRREGNSSKN
jgi:potassium channel LctB